MRVSELTSIRTESIDLESKQVFIRKLKIKRVKNCSSCSYTSGHKTKFCPGCGQDISMIEPIDSNSTRTRRRLVNFSEETSLLVGLYLKTLNADSPWLFPSPRDPSESLHSETVRIMVQESAKKVGLGGKILDHPEFDSKHAVSPHRLRDALAVAEFKKNPTLEGIRVIAYKLGHSNPETTYKHYVKITASGSDD